MFVIDVLLLTLVLVFAPLLGRLRLRKRQPTLARSESGTERSLTLPLALQEEGRGENPLTHTRFTGRFSPDQFWNRFAARRSLAVVTVGLVAFVGSGLLSWAVGFHEPIIHDEFSYLLGADTFAQGRWTNPPHPLWEHFDTFHVLQHPSYQTKYPPAQSLFLALGKRLGHPLIGVWLSMGLCCAAICWMFQAWMPPRWALLGSLFVVVRLVFMSSPVDWSQSYAGGGVAALGGAITFGAIRRMIKEPRVRTSILFAIGLLLLANSRPYEGLMAAVPVLLLLFGWMIYQFGLGARSSGVGQLTPAECETGTGPLLTLPLALQGEGKQGAERLPIDNRRDTRGPSPHPALPPQSRGEGGNGLPPNPALTPQCPGEGGNGLPPSFALTPKSRGEGGEGESASVVSPSVIIRCIVIPVGLVLLLGFGVMAYYNWQVTGSPLTMPALLHQRQYDMAPKFHWQSARSEPNYTVLELKKIHVDWEYRDLYLHSSFVRAGLESSWDVLRFFLGLLLWIPLLALPFIFHGWWMRFALFIVAVEFAALSMEIAFLPHYAAPIASLIYLFVIQSYRHLRLFRRRTSHYGKGVARGLIPALLISCACFLLGGSWVSAQVWEGHRNPNTYHRQRASVVKDLESRGGKHLILVRYCPSHFVFFEWIYNDADIDNSQVVWARELDDVRRQQLLDYYPERTVWVLEADKTPSRLMLFREPVATR